LSGGIEGCQKRCLGGGLCQKRLSLSWKVHECKPLPAAHRAPRAAVLAVAPEGQRISRRLARSRLNKLVAQKALA